MKATLRVCYGGCLAVVLVVATLAAPIAQKQTDTGSINEGTVRTEDVMQAEKELQALSHEGADSVPLPKVGQKPLGQYPLPAETTVLKAQGSDGTDNAHKDVDTPNKRLMPLPEQQLSNQDNDDVRYELAAMPPFAEEAPKDYQESASNNVDLTPQAVAEYLIVTGDFNGFDQAITDLVKTDMLTPTEIKEYKMAVRMEYEALLQQLLDAESAYQQDLTRPLQLTDYYNPSGAVPQSDVSYLVPEYSPEPEALDLDLDLQGELDRMQYQRAVERQQQEQLNELLDAMLDEYYTNIGQADTPAYDFDNTVESSNPEDMQQIMEWMKAALTEEQEAGPMTNALPAPQLPAEGADDAVQQLENLSQNDEKTEEKANETEAEAEIEEELASEARAQMGEAPTEVKSPGVQVETADA